MLRATWARYDALLAAPSDPAAMQQMLEDAGVDMEVTHPPEVGKHITVVEPVWRKEWGVSAEEN